VYAPHPRRIEDRVDERGVAHALGFRLQHQVAQPRIKPRQGIHLQDVGPVSVVCIQPEIHARDIAAAGHAEDRSCQQVELFHQLPIEWRGAPVAEIVRPLGLHAIGVDAPLALRVCLEVDLEGREEVQPGKHAACALVLGHAPRDRRRKVAHHAHGHLATADEALDEDGLAVTRELLG